MIGNTCVQHVCTYTYIRTPCMHTCLYQLVRLYIHTHTHTHIHTHTHFASVSRVYDCLLFCQGLLGLASIPRCVRGSDQKLTTTAHILDCCWIAAGLQGAGSRQRGFPFADANISPSNRSSSGCVQAGRSPRDRDLLRHGPREVTLSSLGSR